MVPHPCVAIPPPGHPEDETTLKEAWNWRCDRHHRNALFNLPSASIGRRWALPEEITLTPRTGRAGRLYPGTSDINLFRYCKGIIHVNARIT